MLVRLHRLHLKFDSETPTPEQVSEVLEKTLARLDILRVGAPNEKEAKEKRETRELLADELFAAKLEREWLIAAISLEKSLLCAEPGSLAEELRVLNLSA